MVIGSEPSSLIHFRLPLLQELRRRGTRVLAIAFAGNDAVKDRLAREGVRFISTEARRNAVTILGDLRLGFALCKVVRREKPDVVLCYTMKPVAYGLIAAWLCGVRRRVAMVTGLGYLFDDSRREGRVTRLLGRNLLKLGLQVADAVILQNPDDEFELRRRGILPRRVPTKLVRGSGVDLAAFPALAPGIENVVLMVARLVRAKGVVEFCRAAVILRREFPSLDIRLIGPLDQGVDGIPEKVIRQLAEDGGVSWLGEQKDIRAALAAAAVVALPSYREGTPRVLLEAMASARAVVATDVPGCRECVVDGETGLLVPARNSEELAAAIGELLRNPERRNLMGEKARIRAKCLFEAGDVARETANVVLGEAVTVTGGLGASGISV